MTDLTQRRVDTEDRDGNPINFLGVELGHASSRRGPDQVRWTEISIFRTEGGNYVLERCGVSTRPGEVLKQRAQVEEDPAAVIAAMYQHEEQTGLPYLTYTARECLFQAMEADPGLARAWESRSQVVA